MRLVMFSALLACALAAPPRSVQLPGEVISVPGPPTPPIASPLSPENELEADRDKRRAIFEEINRNNPMTYPAGLPTAAVHSPQLSTEQLEQIKKIQNLLDHPSVKKYISIISDSQVSAEVQALLKSDRPKHLGIAQLIWILVYLGLKGASRQRLSKARLLKRITTRVSLFFLFLIVASVILPSVILGSGYLRILSRIYIIAFGS
jgi:hypothetical protein